MYIKKYKIVPIFGQKSGQKTGQSPLLFENLMDFTDVKIEKIAKSPKKVGKSPFLVVKSGQKMGKKSIY